MNIINSDGDFVVSFSNKIGHPLQEIRVRALKNILQKLELGLVSESHLASDFELLKRLLQWFNYDNYSNAYEVLDLLLKLSKHSKASIHLSQLGAVKFLSSLRKDVGSDLQVIVDQILENCFLLPDDEVVPDDKSLPPDEAEVIAVNRAATESAAPSIGVIVTQSCPVCSNDPRDHHHGDDLPSRTTSPTPEEYSGFKIISLKWVSVSETDLRILQSTNSSLESNDNQQMINACSFLTDVVLQDFPAEVFLQYSSTIQNLLQLMGRNANEQQRLNLQVLKCLSCLTQSLLARVNYCRDAAMYNCKREPGSPEESSNGPSSESLDSRPSVIGQNDPRPRGDGQDNETSSSNNNAATIASINTVVWTNRSQEISVPHFCLLILRQSTVLLYLPSPQVLHAAINLLNHAAELLQECIFPFIWNDPSVLAQDVCQRLMECYDALASVSVKKYDKCMASNPAVGNTFKIHLTVARFSAMALTNLLNISLAPHRISSLRMSEVTADALARLTLDFVFANTNPRLHKSILEYAKHARSKGYEDYLEILRKRLCLESAVSFDSMVKDGRFDSADLLRFAKDALPALAYYHNWEFFNCFLDCISKVNNQDVPISVRTGLSDILKTLFDYPERETKIAIYQICQRFVAKCFEVQKAVNPACNATTTIAFVLDTEILKCIIHSGLDSSVQEISSASHEILLIILNGKLLMTADLWKIVLNCIHPVIAVLQAYTPMPQTPLGLVLFRLVDTTNSDWNMNELLKCNIRLLFSKDNRLRSQVIPRIVWFLAKEDDALQKLPALSKLNATQLADSLVRQGSSSPPLQPRVAHQVGNVLRLLELFLSEMEAITMRKTAAHQLTYLINDESAYSAFQSVGGLDRVLTILHLSLMTDVQAHEKLPNVVELLPATIGLLYGVILHDPRVVQQMEADVSIYYSLLRALLICMQDVQVVGKVSKILALLLFQDVCFFVNGAEPSLSTEYAAIVKSFQLPFDVTVVTFGTDGSSVSMLKQISNDPSIVAMVNRNVRFSWNSIMTGGWGNLMATVSFPESQSFALTDIDRELLKAARHDSIIEGHFQDIIGATTHKNVLVSLKFLCLDIITLPIDHLKHAKFPHVGLFDEAFSRFLKACPKSSADKTLIRYILEFFTFVLGSQESLDCAVIIWMYEQINLKNGAIYHLMRHPHDIFTNDEMDSSVYSPLTRELVAFGIALLSNTPYCCNEKQKMDEIHRAIYGMIHFVLQHLNLAEAPQFYNLASLEAVLQCLVHITARPGFSIQKTNAVGQNICHQLTGLLMEVVAAFHLSHENNTHSYMGRGVTVAATASLAHIARETCYVTTGDEWIKDWFYIVDNPEGSSQLGLGWLIPLWTHKDPQVRAASIGIVVTFTETKAGCELVSLNIQQVAGGLWGVALSFLLEHSEACIVREQAALMLANLTAHSMVESRIPGARNMVPLMDVAGVLVLLQNSNFVKEITVVLASFTSNLWLKSYIQNKATQPVVANPAASCTLVTTDFGLANFSIGGAGLPQLIQPPEPSSSQETPQEFLTDTGESKHFSLANSTLVSAICQLLQNLIIMEPLEMLQQMKLESIFECMLRVLEESKLCLLSEHDIPGNMKMDAIHMHTALFRLLGTCCAKDSWLRTYMQADPKIFTELCCYLECIMWKEIREMHTCLYKLLSLLCHEMTDVHVKNLFKGLTEKLPTILKCLTVVLSSENELGSLKIAAMTWLSRMLALLSNQYCSSNITSLLDEKIGDGEGTESGEVIMSLLLKIHNKIIITSANTDDSGMRITCETMGLLLAVSQSAKRIALKYKFPEAVIDRIRKNLSRMSIISSEQSRRNSKTKDTHYVLDLVLHLDVLSNFLFRNHEGKIAANKHGLCMTLSEYWPLILTHPTTILPSALFVLCTFTAHCPQAAKSLALNRSNSSSLPGNACQKRATVGSGVLLVEILKDCQAQLTSNKKWDNGNVLNQMFTLLTTVSMVPACRSIIFKQSKFLQNFSSLIARKSSSTCRLQNNEDPVLLLWLQLFANVSLQSEGQDIVLHIPDSLATLFDLMENGGDRLRDTSLVILRNLSFLPATKTTILSCNKFLRIITSLALNCECDDHSQLLATTILWSLIANNQKGKLIIKENHFVDKLEDTIERMQIATVSSSGRANTLEVLTTVLSLLKNAKES